MANSEATFSAEVRSDLELIYKENIHVNLIPDMMRTGKKPYDFYFNFRDHFTAVECKRVNGHSINYKNHIKPHQPDCLRAVTKSGGTGIFLICFNEHKRSFICTPDTLDMLVNEVGDSIKIDVFQKHEMVSNVFVMDRIKDREHSRKPDQIGCTRWEVEKLVYVAERY